MQREIRQNTPNQKVSAILTFVGFGMRPEELTDRFGVQPSTTDVSYVNCCWKGRKEECGLWSYDTSENVTSRDVGMHLEHLLQLFGPLKSQIEEMRPPANVFVHVRCEASSIMQPLHTPKIEAKHVAGLASLGAALTIELFEV